MTKETNDTDEISQVEREQRYHESAQLSIAVLREQIAPILMAIAQDYNGDIIAMLRPEDEDYAEVFQHQSESPVLCTCSKNKFRPC